MKSVAVLFARRNSVYKTFPDCDVFDIDRNALTFTGDMPIVAHPPCRGWGTLSHMAHHTEEEKQLAIWAVQRIRQNGGVLEHPKRSKLWEHLGLPRPGQGRDQFGGWTLGVAQQWFGHRAEKLTLLYIVGVEPRDIPPMPIVMGEPTHVISRTGRRRDGTRKGYNERFGLKKECSKAEREHTPQAFAEWLCELARRCSMEVL